MACSSTGLAHIHVCSTRGETVAPTSHLSDHRTLLVATTLTPEKSTRVFDRKVASERVITSMRRRTAVMMPNLLKLSTCDFVALPALFQHPDDDALPDRQWRVTRDRDDAVCGPYIASLAGILR